VEPVAFIGMETSGTLRRRFQARGFRTFSADLLPSEDGGEGHLVMDVFAALDYLAARGLWPTLAVFHPDCTYLTNSAAWAFTDGPYHQQVKPGTLVGAARREAREKALETVRRVLALPIKHKAVENPIGAISRVRKFDQIVQPNWFGDDASKATGLILDNLPRLHPTHPIPGRLVEWPRGSGRMCERWGNQTDSGQNRLTPGPDRWKDRARTYPGLADAVAHQWSGFLLNRAAA